MVSDARMLLLFIHPFSSYVKGFTHNWPFWKVPYAICGRFESHLAIYEIYLFVLRDGYVQSFPIVYRRGPSRANTVSPHIQIVPIRSALTSKLNLEEEGMGWAL